VLVRKTQTGLRVLAIVTLLALGVGVYAWHYYAGRYPSWSEEVRLSDGRVIVVMQRHEVYENYGINQSWVTITLPELGGEQVWNAYLVPLRVDVDNGKVFVFGAPRGVRQFNFYRKPRNYLVAFQWNGSQFERILFLSVPERLRQEENVFSCVPAGPPKLLTLDQKQKQWCPVRGDKWRFGKSIFLADYAGLASFYAGLDNTQPQSD
jgi:hypothetical protein